MVKSLLNHLDKYRNLIKDNSYENTQELKRILYTSYRDIDKYGRIEYNKSIKSNEGWTKY